MRITRADTGDQGNRDIGGRPVRAVKESGGCHLANLDCVKHSVCDEPKEGIIIVQVIDTTRRLRRLALVEVGWDEQCTGVTEVGSNIDNAGAEASRVCAVAVLEAITRPAENVTVLICVVWIGRNNAVEEIVFADLLEQCVDKHIDLYPGNEGDRRTMRLELRQFGFRGKRLMLQDNCETESGSLKRHAEAREGIIVPVLVVL
jgi:hypothetical protein